MKYRIKYIKNFILSFFSGLVNLKKRYKICFLLIVDYCLIFFSLNLVNFFLELNDYFINQLNTFQLNFLVLGCISTFVFTEQYNSLSRYIGSTEIYSICKRNLFLIPVLFTVNIVLDSELIIFRFYFLFWIITSF